MNEDVVILLPHIVVKKKVVKRAFVRSCVCVCNTPRHPKYSREPISQSDTYYSNEIGLLFQAYLPDERHTTQNRTFVCLPSFCTVFLIHISNTNTTIMNFKASRQQPDEPLVSGSLLRCLSDPTRMLKKTNWLRSPEVFLRNVSA